MNNVNKAKLRASFVTYLALRKSPVRLSEYMDFINTVDLGLGKSVSTDEMSSVINRDSFTKNVGKIRSRQGHYLYYLEK